MRISFPGAEVPQSGACVKSSGGMALYSVVPSDAVACVYSLQPCTSFPLLKYHPSMSPQSPPPSLPRYCRLSQRGSGRSLLRPWGCRAFQLMLGRGMAPSPSSVSGGGNLPAVGWGAEDEEERGRRSSDKPNDLNTVVLYLHAGCFYMLVSNFTEC